MNLVFPIVVVYENDKFHSHTPAVGETDEFCRSYISANNLDVDTTEIFLYERKDWISLLLESKNSGLKFLIEKDIAKTVKNVVVLEEVDEEINWMKESNLSQYYSSSEILKIEENKSVLADCSFVSQEVLESLPNAIPTKTRKVTAKRIVEESVTEIVGLKYEV